MHPSVRRHSSSPLVGRTDSAEGRARRGLPGIGLLVEVGRRDISRRGKRQAIRQALVPAADTAECFVDKATPLRARPSAESVLPHKGGGEVRAATMFHVNIRGLTRCPAPPISRPRIGLR